MTFLAPAFLWSIPAILALGVLVYLWSRRIRRRRLSQFTTLEESAEIVRSSLERKRQVRHALVVLGLVLLSVALARPATGPKSSSKEHAVVDVLIALDVSLSMNAEDVKPSRRAAAKAALNEWLAQARNVRVGLILFAGEAFLQMPFTTDLRMVQTLVNAANSKGAGVGGSNFGKAIDTAATAYERAGSVSRALIILSDGEATVDDDLEKVLTRASLDHRLRIYTIGVGTSAGAEIPTFYPDGRQIGVAKNKYGVPVVSHLDSTTLRTIAHRTGGSYMALRDNPDALKILQSRQLSKLLRETRVVDATDYDEWFQIPLLLAFLCMILEPLLGRVVGFRRTARSVPAVSIRTTAAAACLCIVFGSGTADAADAERERIGEIQVLIEQGRVAEARQKLEPASGDRPLDARSLYNLGVAAYAADDFAQAAEYFEQSLNTGDEEIASDALFQLGNSRVRIAEALIREKDSGGGTLELERALGSYDRAGKGRRVRKNRAITLDYFTEVLEGMADYFLATAEASKGDDWAEMRNLTKAIGTLEKILEHDEAHEPSRQKLDAAKKKLSDNRVRDAQKELAIGKRAFETSPKGAYVNMNRALLSAESAVELNPESQPAQETRDEVRKAWSVMHTEQAKVKIAEAEKTAKLSTKLGQYETAANSAQEALELDPDNTEAAEVLAQAREGIEKTAVEEGDRLVEAAEKAKTAKGESSLLTTALERFEEALSVNPDNQYARERAEAIRPMLAEAMAAMGKDELEGAKETLAAAGEQDTPENLQTAMDQLGMADHGFSEAKGLGNESEAVGAMQEEARALAGEVQQRIDALAAGQAPPGGEGEEGAMDLAEGSFESGDSEPMELRSFSDIRSVGAGGRTVQPEKYW